MWMLSVFCCVSQKELCSEGALTLKDNVNLITQNRETISNSSSTTVFTYPKPKRKFSFSRAAFTIELKLRSTLSVALDEADDLAWG